MRTTIAAVYEDGVFKPEHPVALEDKARVRLMVEPTAETEDGETDDWRAIDELIGFIEDAPAASIGRDHDEILYRR